MKDNDSNKKNEIINKKKKAPFLSTKKRHQVFLIAIVFEIVLVFLALNYIYMNVTVHSSKPLSNEETSETDKLSASDGVLKVNNVSVKVPKVGDEKYDMSFSWKEGDSKYPTIPRAVTVTYPDKNGKLKYNLSLYRLETVRKKDIPSGKNSENWFSDWEIVGEGEVVQRPLDTKKVKGFFISPNTDQNNSFDAYNTYTYYFSVSDYSGIHIYVLEGVCDNASCSKELDALIRNCISSIIIEPSSV